MQIAELLVKQQGELEPHQLGFILSQRQKELSEAMQRTKEAEAAAESKIEQHDSKASSIDDDFAKAVQAAVDARTQAAAAMAVERKEMVTALNVEISSARTAMAMAQQLMDSVQDQINSLSEEDSTEESTEAARLTRESSSPITPITVKPMATLPEAKPVEEADLPYFAFAARVLDHHSMQDKDFPLTIGDIGLPRASLATMVGADLWTQYFPGAAPERTARVPRRLLGAIKVAITRMALTTQAFSEAEEDKASSVVTAAAKAFDDWQAEPSAGQHALAPY